LAIKSLRKSIEDVKAQLETQEKLRDEKLELKEELNRKLEITLGPALREGYWTPDTYEDHGESKIVE
jgi:hypothetical protein